MYCFAQTVDANNAIPKNSSSIQFIENKGQWDAQVLFKANIPGGSLYITAAGLHYALVDEHAIHAITHGESSPSTPINAHNYKMEFSGGNKTVTVQKGNMFSEYYNYYVGDNPKQWASDCKAFQSILLQNIYNGIDAEIVGVKDYIKLNFIVKPFANPNLIKLLYTGQSGLLLKNGELQVSTTVGNIKEEKPFAYQHASEVQCVYQLAQNEVSFDVGIYNHSQLLVIDPNIVFGTFSGSVSDNFGNTATFDNAGNAWAGGTVYGGNFPVTQGAYQFTFGGGIASNGGSRDVSILKFSSDGTQLICGTFLGGSNNEQPHSVICNSEGDIYILGTTYSPNFATTAGAFDRFFNGQADIFISQLASDGKSLKASTYFGGSDDDGINGSNPNSQQFTASNPLTYNYGDFYRGEIQFDNQGNITVASTTQSSHTEGYPLQGEFQATFGGGNNDGCVFKLNARLSSLLFSSFIGGEGEDAAQGLVVDKDNTIFICGGTNSNNIGKSQGTFTFEGGVDAFIAKIPASNDLEKLIYLGTSQYDQAYFIGLDGSENVYITGQTKGSFLVKGNVYSNTGGKQFISCLNNGLDTIKLSTVFGASGSSTPNISPSGFLIDECGRVYVSGWGGGTNKLYNAEVGSTTGMPISANAFQSSTDGSDFYLLVMGKDLASLDYATFYGGNFSNEHVDGGTSRFDKRGIVYQSVCAGCGGFSDFPTTSGAYSRTNNSSNCNNAVFKVDLNVSSRPPVVKDTILFVMVGNQLRYDFTIFDPDNDSLIVIFGGNFLGLTPNVPTLLTTRTKAKMEARLNWQPTCHDSTIIDTFEITIEAKDDGCFEQNTTNASIKIVVIPLPPLNPPYPECLKTITDSVAQLKWNSISNIGGFKDYRIYKKVANNPFQLFGIYNNPFLETITDDYVPNHLTSTNYCYYIETRNSCNAISTPSRLICSLFQYDTLLSPIFKSTRDTILFVIATDTLTYQFVAQTVDVQDSMFISVSGNMFAQNKLITSSVNNGLGQATFQFSFKSLCDDVNRLDTFTIDLFLRDNQCPQSRTQRNSIKIVVIPPPAYNPPTLKCTRSVSNNSVLVRWDKTVTGKYFSHFVLLKKSPSGVITAIATVKSDSGLAFTDTEADDNEIIDYCYAAFAVNVCNTIGDTSDLSCTVNKSIITPDPIYIYTTTVEQNKRIVVYWKPSDDPDFLQYRLLKKEKGTPQFTSVKTTSLLTDTVYVDEDVAVSKQSYCYKLRQTNDCGIENKDEIFSCSILLKGTSIPFTHELAWSGFNYFAHGIKEYSIYKNSIADQPSIAGTTFFKQTGFTDNALNIDNGIYYYTIEAAENNSPYKSLSNTIELIQKPLLYVPNAFTPNGDGNNDTWKTRPVFVKDYNLKLYDRWGKLIFETNHKHESLKDEILNDPATSDVFVYVVTYTGWDDSTHTQKGNVTILK